MSEINTNIVACPQVDPSVMVALGRHCSQLRALRVENYVAAQAPGEPAPDFAELAALTTLEDLQLSFSTPGSCAACPL